jgi:hypothetical protein
MKYEIFRGISVSEKAYTGEDKLLYRNARKGIALSGMV